MASLGNDAPTMRRTLLGVLIAAVLQGLSLACVLPLFVAVLAEHDRGAAFVWLTAMTLLGIASAAVKWWASGYEFRGGSAHSIHRLRLALGEQLRRMPLEKLADKRSGELHSALLGNVDEQIAYVTMVADLILNALVTPLVVAAVTLFFDVRLGLALFVAFPTVAFLYRWRRPAFDLGFQALADAHEKTNGDVVEYTQGLAVLRASRADGSRAKALHAGFQHLQDIQTQYQRKNARPSVFISTVIEVGLLSIAMLGVAFVVRGSLDVAVLAAVIVLMTRFVAALSNVINYTALFALIETALTRVEALLAIEPLPVTPEGRAPETWEVGFHGVTFTYSGANEPVLRDVSTTLPARAMAALVGPSGSGKTTLTRLLMRHADPQVGRITVGGVDVRALEPEALNSLVSVVFQDVYLFDDTVRANILMGRPSATEAELSQVARDAQCLDFIERLPNGWDTRLGDLGGRLSGGERQRISIARALLKDAPIVILDEPTAALDTQSERAVQRAIDALVKNKTVIVIAHRLSTIAGADQIVVLDDGRVVQQGRHDELLVEGGRYGAMWAAQQSVKAWHVGSGRR
ncbi:ABC transporter ATP-binding protein [Pseudenhygromyxa sp. WMMC2535]|uniref:ABC transporter ATP-binding protein n=1 Tax=Pseudenhygromyxa sp. WMMC2535 TaxID=2712867 RepID=UPI001C3D20C8|nr:ABC transporter ATP-binding protein [Pseudenhygromyxa sp. WMMC2535]